jgi:hypothetical protein
VLEEKGICSKRVEKRESKKTCVSRSQLDTHTHTFWAAKIGLTWASKDGLAKETKPFRLRLFL